MRAMLGAIVDGHDVVNVLWVSVASGVGVTAVFGFAIVGIVRSVDLSRDGRAVEAALAAILGLVALAAVLSALVYGIVVMTQK
jgi:hypothetical protein